MSHHRSPRHPQPAEKRRPPTRSERPQLPQRTRRRESMDRRTLGQDRRNQQRPRTASHTSSRIRKASRRRRSLGSRRTAPLHTLRWRRTSRQMDRHRLDLPPLPRPRSHPKEAMKCATAHTSISNARTAPNRRSAHITLCYRHPKTDHTEMRHGAVPAHSAHMSSQCAVARARTEYGAPRAGRPRHTHWYTKIMAQGRHGRPWRRIRAQVLATSTQCWICGHPGADTVDHIIPLSLGGDPLDIANLRPAHHSCNSRRGNKISPPRPTNTSRRW